ncbi:MAG: glycosyl transferase family 2 [Deltaproteobacteria bacterium]|nr:glycosyl transferase family 2 [Deltaproteobacteria bacterium]
MPGQPQASIIIPTINRVACLTGCLEALAALNTSPATFEIIVVDNNSSDNTRDVAFSFAQAHPSLRLRYVHEARQGVSYARNSGIAAACGPIVCFLDDDARPLSEWLTAVTRGFLDPAVGCVGGPAILDYQGRERPPWLRADLQGLLSGYALPYVEPTGVSEVSEFPFGCNMAFRRKIIDEVGVFRADLDRLGHQLLAAGDTEMIARVHRAGWKVLYVPEAQVRHLVAPERLKKEYIYQVGLGLARSHVLLTADPRSHIIARWFASDSWYAARMLYRLLVALLRRKELWFDDYMRFWMVAQRIPSRVRNIWNSHGQEGSQHSESPRST